MLIGLVTTKDTKALNYKHSSYDTYHLFPCQSRMHADLFVNPYYNPNVSYDAFPLLFHLVFNQTLVEK